MMDAIRCLRRCTWVLGVALLGSRALAADPAPPAPPPAAPAVGELSAYHIGNSLTFGVASHPRYAAMLGAGLRSYTWGMHILWGMPLAAIWDRQDQPSMAPQPYGAFPHALGAYTWQVVTLQPSFAVLEGARGDVALCERFIALVRQKSPDAQCYVYETWPTIGKQAPAGAFLAKWSRTYEPGRCDGALYSHDYCRRLLDRLHADDPHAARPLLLLPAGTVLAAVDARARAEPALGLPTAEQLYQEDGTHLNDRGNYIVTCAWFAVLRRAKPIEPPGCAQSAGFTQAQGAAIRDLVWDVVSHDAASGVSPLATTRGP